MNQSQFNSKIWARLLTTMESPPVRAPSSTPYLASTTKFVRSVDIPYDAATGGRFNIIATPDPRAAMLIGQSSINIPSVPGTISISSSSHSGTEVGSPYVSRGVLKVSQGERVLTVMPFQDSGLVSGIAASGIPCISMNIAAGSDVILNVLMKDPDFQVQVATITLAGALDPWVEVKPEASQTATLRITAALAKRGLVFRLASAGVPISGDFAHDVSLSLVAYIAQAVVQTTVDSQTLVKADLISEAKINSLRATSIKMLVTNMAAPVNSGGEVVVGRVPAQVINERGFNNLADTIKRLPESLYWSSRAVADGGYAWWLPDDLNSYEPHPMETISTENVLVAAGNLTVGGLIRVMVTWTYEFYTPVQLFERSYNLPYTDLDRAVWATLSQQPATSGNPDHGTLLRMIAGAVSAFVNAYFAGGTNFAISAMSAANSAYSEYQRRNPPKKSKPKNKKKPENSKVAPKQAPAAPKQGGLQRGTRQLR